jgi:hypothetical protein
METEVDKFLEATKKVRSDYRSIDVRVIAYHIKQDRPAGDVWVNLASRFTLLANADGHQIRNIELSQIPELWVLHTLSPIEDFERTIDIFRTGEFSYQGKTVLFKKWTNGWNFPYGQNFRRFTREQSVGRTGLDALTFVLAGGENYLQSVVGDESRNRLEARLSAVETPFSNLEDLAIDFIGPHIWGWGDPWQTSSAEIVAPVTIRISQGSVINDHLTFQLTVNEGHRASDLRVGYVFYMGSQSLGRGTLSPTKLEDVNKRPEILGGSLELPDTAETALLLLSYRKEEVDRLRVFRGIFSGRNPRMTAQEVVDPGLKSFSQGIAGEGVGAKKKDKGKGFERSVLLLFHFLGFSSVSTFPEATDSADVLAFTGVPGEVLLIECTTDAPDLRNKLGKLSSRNRAYGQRKPPLRIAPVIVTSLTMEDVSPVDLERARKEKITILTAAELRELVTMANAAKGPPTVLDYFRRIAPSPFQ